jgi:DNA-binding response OmpR family regulator
LIFHCIVVSTEVDRQQMLAEAAVQSGWETTVCGDAASALGYLRRGFLQLAIVDLASDSTGEFADLLQQFASQGGVLSIVCGNDGDDEEEIWVRQAGAWLYLPGVDDGTHVSLLCGEARHVVERMHAASTSQPQRTSMRRAQ